MLNIKIIIVLFIKYLEIIKKKLFKFDRLNIKKL